MEKEVSPLDLKIYRLIRENIENFMLKSASLYDIKGNNILDIAPQIHEGAKSFFVKSNVFTADIDINSGADFIVDICKTNIHVIDSNKFDVVVCTEVLEHTLNPFLAIEEIYRIISPNGVLLLTTPFNFRIHGPLPDCWRFTIHGLKTLLKKFQIIEIIELEDEDRFLMPYQYTVTARKK